MLRVLAGLGRLLKWTGWWNAAAWGRGGPRAAEATVRAAVGQQGWAASCLGARLPHDQSAHTRSQHPAIAPTAPASLQRHLQCSSARCSPAPRQQLPAGVLHDAPSQQVCPPEGCTRTTRRTPRAATHPVPNPCPAALRAARVIAAAEAAGNGAGPQVGVAAAPPPAVALLSGGTLWRPREQGLPTHPRLALACRARRSSTSTSCWPSWTPTRCCRRRRAPRCRPPPRWRRKTLASCEWGAGSRGTIRSNWAAGGVAAADSTAAGAWRR